MTEILYIIFCFLHQKTVNCVQKINTILATRRYQDRTEQQKKNNNIQKSQMYSCPQSLIKFTPERRQKQCLDHQDLSSRILRNLVQSQLDGFKGGGKRGDGRGRPRNYKSVALTVVSRKIREHIKHIFTQNKSHSTKLIFSFDRVTGPVMWGSSR